MHLTKNSIYKTAVYLRLSRDDFNKVESDSISNQRNLILNYLKEHTDLEYVSEYIDDGYTGTNFDRPGFQKMFSDLQAGIINCVVVKDMSRLGRNYIDTGQYMETIFPSMNVRLIAITDGYDSADKSNEANNNIVIPFKNLINDAYCRDISIKVRSQLDVKRKDGKFIGSFPSYGYMRDPEDKHHLIIDEFAADIVRKIFTMKLDGYSQANIAAELNALGVLTPYAYKRSLGFNYSVGFAKSSKPKWEASSINRILTNEMYVGSMVQGTVRKINYKIKKLRPVDPEDWIIVKGTHEPIISQTIFDAVQHLLEFDTRTPTSKKVVEPLSGFVKCGDCGENMVKRTVTKKGIKYCYYYCSTYKAGKGCHSHSISASRLEEAVLTAIQKNLQLFMDAVEITRTINEARVLNRPVKLLDDQAAVLDKEILRLNELKIHLYQDKADGILDLEEYKILNEQFSEKIKIAMEKKEAIEQRRGELSMGKIIKSPWVEEYLNMGKISVLTRKAMALLVDQVIVYDKNRIEIVFAHRDEIKAILDEARDYEDSLLKANA